LVDCPGHASLIRTIIGGAQIIDIMFLVIDLAKGIQAQTAECIIIAELYTKKMIVVLNKVDLIEDKKTVDSKISALRKVFGKTKFGENVRMVPFSTKNSEQ
jgi:selenocysteine-specific elongation factor